MHRQHIGKCTPLRSALRVVAGIIFGAGLVSHPASSAESASAGDAAASQLVPLEVFAANPTYENIKVSPTGEYLAATFFNPEDVTESKLVVLDIQNMEVTAIAHVRGRDFISNLNGHYSLLRLVHSGLAESA